MSYTNMGLNFRNLAGTEMEVRNMPTGSGVVYSNGTGDFKNIVADTVYDELITARGQKARLNRFIRYETLFEHSTGVSEALCEFVSGMEYRIWVAVSWVVRAVASYGYPKLDHYVGYQRINFSARHIPNTDEKYNTHTMIPVELPKVEYDENIWNRVAYRSIESCALMIPMEYNSVSFFRIKDGMAIPGIFKIERAATSL